ncbi:MAG TPA: class A beta-lactamase [Bryobacteraceae bacterium]|nr:class A beta-lactamase [Bryobacteraceae bacterium]
MRELRRNQRLFVAAALFACGSAALSAGSLDRAGLDREFQKLAAGFDGRVGICAQDRAGAVCLDGDGRFSLQSVMKLVAAVAVMDAIDAGRMRLNEEVLVRKEDLSVFVQPIAKLVTANGYRTTIGDLIRRAIVDSDSAAVDILIGKLGGPEQVQAFLNSRSIQGLRVDRTEKRLQSEIVGLHWRPEFTDPAVFARAIQSVPEETRDASYSRYQADPRDTSTPKAMADFLYRLAEGKLLSRQSTEFIVTVMHATATFPDRLKAGLARGWKLGHKTGTSGAWKGVTAATNDAGILTSPAGDHVAIVVFIGDSRAASEQKAKLMAAAARAAIDRFLPTPAERRAKQ